MTDYKQLYIGLFGAIADAVEHMEAQNYGMARACLVCAMQNAEEEYIGEEEKATE